MEIDYAKLAKANNLVFKWRNKLKSHINKKNIKFFSQTYGLRPVSGTLIYVKFFTKNYKEAVNILGSEFEKEYKDLFYAFEIENDLIKQYQPAIYRYGMQRLFSNKGKRNEYEVDELESYLLLCLRDCVWNYREENIKFSTFAISSIKKNSRFFFGNASRNRSSCPYPMYEDMKIRNKSGTPLDFSEVIVSNAKTETGALESSAVIEKLCDLAGITDRQRSEITKYVKTGEYSKFTFFVARKALREFVESQKDDESFITFEDIKFPRD